MANSAQARKRARQGVERRERNMGQRSTMRTHVKRVLAAIQAGDKEAAAAAFKSAVSVLDKSVTKGIVHKNKAARHKSRLSGHIKAMG